MKIDIEKLRNDLIDYLGTAFYTGYDVAIVEISKVQNASAEELIAMVEQYGFNLNEYETYTR